MRQRFSDRTVLALRAIAAGAFVAAFLLTLALSAFPQLHERLHQASSSANHECAVTLLSSGNYQHTPTDTIAIVPPPARLASPFVNGHFQLVSPRLEFSLLEHAPPALS